MSRIASLLVVAAALSCGPSGPRNPPKLFIALNGSESMIKLVPVEPNPF
jgi:hypothetical protein